MSHPEEHPLFDIPEDKDIKIWRFMDFTKYVSLLESKRLFFSRADRLGDPFEGSISKRSMAARKYIAEKFGREVQGVNSALVELAGFEGKLWDSVEADTYHLRWNAEWMFISCWHMNPVESSAMWQLYAPSGHGVALQTTYRKLRESLPNDVYIGKVQYICYEKDLVDLKNAFSPFICKRESFSHEAELRAIHHDSPKYTKRDENTGEEVRAAAHHVRNSEGGKSFAVDLDHLVENLYVSPVAESWYAELVTSVTQRYSCTFPVNQSSLDATPIF